FLVEDRSRQLCSQAGSPGRSGRMPARRSGGSVRGIEGPARQYALPAAVDGPDQRHRVPPPAATWSGELLARRVGSASLRGGMGWAQAAARYDWTGHQLPQTLEFRCRTCRYRDDWTSTMRYLCRACSEGRPHETHDQERE